MKTKLLFVISQFYNGGAETSLLNLLKFLNKETYDVDLLVMRQVPANNSVSLLDQIPKEVKVFNAFEEDENLSFFTKLKAKLNLTEYDTREYPISATLNMRNKQYDWAFHVGEWWNPGFVAEKVHAKHKCAWIHTDISDADYFDAQSFFNYDSCFEQYIFVSENSLKASLAKFPFLKNKATCIYNINDIAYIRKRANESVEEDFFNGGLPVVLTCANVRYEKNHNRQLTVMSILKERGVDFLWLNIGGKSEEDRCDALLRRAQALGLKDRFILAGPRENPYKYIRQADVLTVLSDYESWSMVITEGKILRKPIVSTKTSGALEQIIDHKTGILTEFDAEHIADCLQELLQSKPLQNTLCDNLKDFDNTEEILESFDKLIQGDQSFVRSEEKELIYVIDDINYLGGAHVATKLQIRALMNKGKQISIFSTSTPKLEVRTELTGVRFLGWRDFPENRLYNRRIWDCFSDPNLTIAEKKLKMKMTYYSKIRKDPHVFDNLLLPNLSNLFSQYHTVCVIGENSAFRRCAADSTCINKVQWIHTDYCSWMNQSDYTKEITKDDAQIYRDYTKIVVLTQNIKSKFVRLYPHLADKVVVNSNLMPVEEILTKAVDRKDKNNTPLHFVTVGRFDGSKGYDRLFRVLDKLYYEGYHFTWTIIGDGVDFAWINDMFQKNDLKNCVKLIGAKKNPFPYVKEADIFALLSNYEGLPTTIYEALILGVPVLATNVGGIYTQIKNGKTGWLVENKEQEIYKILVYLLTHTEEVESAKEALKDYVYDNEMILKNAEDILFPSI